MAEEVRPSMKDESIRIINVNIPFSMPKVITTATLIKKKKKKLVLKPKIAVSDYLCTEVDPDGDPTSIFGDFKKQMSLMDRIVSGAKLLTSEACST